MHQFSFCALLYNMLLPKTKYEWHRMLNCAKRTYQESFFSFFFLLVMASLKNTFIESNFPFILLDTSYTRISC